MLERDSASDSCRCRSRSVHSKQSGLIEGLHPARQELQRVGCCQRPSSVHGYGHGMACRVSVKTDRPVDSTRSAFDVGFARLPAETCALYAPPISPSQNGITGHATSKCAVKLLMTATGRPRSTRALAVVAGLPSGHWVVSRASGCVPDTEWPPPIAVAPIAGFSRVGAQGQLLDWPHAATLYAPKRQCRATSGIIQRHYGSAF